MEAIKTSVTNSPAESEVKGKAVKKSGKRIGYNYIILKSLKESQKNDVVRCLYIKSLTNFGICVIKEGTYGDSKDKQGRDIKDRLMWQKELHEKLQGKVRLPRLLGSFEENGNYYLVLERIKGKSLYKVCREAGKELREGLITGNKLGMKFLGYMIQMIDLLETLHNHGIVHRDVTATNFMITPAGKVAVIDMELSYSLKKSFPDPPFQLGTYGYMSPEQEKTAPPSTDQDVFSVGAILLQMWNGISPSKITDAPFAELAKKVLFFIPVESLAQIVTQCLNPEPFLRPALADLRNALNEYIANLSKKPLALKLAYQKYQRGDILDIIQQGIGTLSSPLLADVEKGWFSENKNISPNVDKRKINKGWYASFQNGACGVIYLLSKLKMTGFYIESARPYIELGINSIRERYINKKDGANPALYLGGSGIAATLAIATREELIEPQTEYFGWINQLIKLDNDVPGYQFGIAGQGCANWLAEPFLHGELTRQRLDGYVDRLLQTQRKDGGWVPLGSNKKKEMTLGFAHGIAGIIYFLLEYAKKYGHKEAEEGARQGIQALAKKITRRGESFKWRSSSSEDLSPWWCEGNAGIALAFMQAYEVLKEPLYKKMAIDTIRNIHPEILDNNLSQCHGLTGLGEVYIEAFRRFEDEEWMHRAGWILQVVMQLRKRHPVHGPYWLVEHERHPVADFMIGNSGILHFLLRYCYADRIGFPLMP